MSDFDINDFDVFVDQGGNILMMLPSPKDTPMDERIAVENVGADDPWAPKEG